MRRRGENKHSETSDADRESPFTEPVVLPIEDSIDLHPFAPKDIPSVVEEYLEQCKQAGLKEVRIIHGRGTGVQRNIVRSILQKHPLVLSFQDAPAEGGGLEERKLVSCKGIFTLGLDEVVDGDQNADGDETVREIECRPVKVRPVEVEKVNNFTVCDPIDQVADRSAENEGKCRDQAGFPVGQTSQHRNDKADRQYRKQHEEG